jgi:hypothetical protein
LKLIAADVGPANVRFLHCGFSSREVGEHLRALNLEGVTTRYGLLDHREAMRITASTHVRIVLLPDNAYTKAQVPAKLYNYLIMNGPVLAIAPEQGAVARIVSETGMGTVVSPESSVRRVADVLRGFFDDWRRGELKLRANQERIAAYDRRKHVEELARIFGAVQAGPLTSDAELRPEMSLSA